jgi:phytoene dehydrogenase-like protein
MAMEPLAYETPPNLPPKSMKDFWEMAMFGLRHRKSMPYFYDLLELQTGSAADIVERWFESPELKGTLAVEGLLGACAGPRSACTAFLLLHVAMGSCGGERGAWAYPRGGMGMVSESLATAAEAAGVKIRTACPVEKILVSGGRAAGVQLYSGEEIRADTVLSSADPFNTFVRMVGEQHLPAEFNERMHSIDYSTAALKLNLALSGLPAFTAIDEASAPRTLRGSIHICGTIDDVEKAFDESKYGVPSAHPTLHCAIPSLTDETIAPKGKHLMNVFAQYAPYDLAEGLHWDEIGERFADRCIAKLEEYAPNIRSLIEHQQVLTPLDMERVFGLYRGNIFHGAHRATQMFGFRPAAQWARYRTPVHRLYLCGAGAHPGGGVTGIPGYNAAKAVMEDGA